MLLRKYVVYLDDGQTVFKAGIPAENEYEAEKLCEGNGEVIAIKDITEECPIDIVKVTEALRQSGFGKIEEDLITRTLYNAGISS